MAQEIDLDKFIKVISNEKTKKDIKLKVEAKKLKNDYVVNVKSLIVTEALFDELGLKGDIVIEKPIVKKAKKPSLRELIEGIATDVQAIKNTPTIKRELNAQKRLKTLKQKQ